MPRMVVRCISVIRREKLSIAENFLYMLKKDYTELDARTLDLLCWYFRLNTEVV